MRTEVGMYRGLSVDMSSLLSLGGLHKILVAPCHGKKPATSKHACMLTRVLSQNICNIYNTNRSFWHSLASKRLAQPCWECICLQFLCQCPTQGDEIFNAEGSLQIIYSIASYYHKATKGQTGKVQGYFKTFVGPIPHHISNILKWT